MNKGNTQDYMHIAFKGNDYITGPFVLLLDIHILYFKQEKGL